MGIFYAAQVLSLAFEPANTSDRIVSLHKKFLAAILDHELTAVRRVHVIFECRLEYPDYDMYITRLLDALLLANADNADEITRVLAHEIKSRNAHDQVILFPAALIAVMRAAMYIRKRNDQCELEENAGVLFGVLLKAYASISDVSPGLTTWLHGEFSRNLPEFLQEEITKAGVVRALGSIDHVQANAQRIFQELNHRLFGMLDFGKQFKLLKSAAV